MTVILFCTLLVGLSLGHPSKTIGSSVQATEVTEAKVKYPTFPGASEPLVCGQDECSVIAAQTCEQEHQALSMHPTWIPGLGCVWSCADAVNIYGSRDNCKATAPGPGTCDGCLLPGEIGPQPECCEEMAVSPHLNEGPDPVGVDTDGIVTLEMDVYAPAVRPHLKQCDPVNCADVANDECAMSGGAWGAATKAVEFATGMTTCVVCCNADMGCHEIQVCHQGP
jgi:hypothetical protein